MINFYIIIFLVILISFFAIAIKILSDIISEKKHKNISKILALVFAIIASTGIAQLAEFYLYYTEFTLLRFILNSFCIFSIYFGISFLIGLIKTKINERKKLKKFYKSSSKKSNLTKFKFRKK